MDTMFWYPARYNGFGVVESRVYWLGPDRALCVNVCDLAPDHADPILLACGLRPQGDGRTTWCVTPLLRPGQDRPTYAAAAFGSLEEAERYLGSQAPAPSAEAPKAITWAECLSFAKSLQDGFRLPRVGGT